MHHAATRYRGTAAFHTPLFEGPRPAAEIALLGLEPSIHWALGSSPRAAKKENPYPTLPYPTLSIKGVGMVTGSRPCSQFCLLLPRWVEVRSVEPCIERLPHPAPLHVDH